MDGSFDIPSLLRRNVPRYTSYPTANHFKPGEAANLSQGLVDAAREAPAVSVYVHIPYCDRMCWFCGCHTKQTQSYDPVRRYMQSLAGEIALYKARFGTRKPPLARLHLGGGSPSLLQRAELEALKGNLAGCFAFTDKTEVSIEIDPSDMTDQRLDALMAFGLTRASLGVQDFDPVVQKAINRPQSYEITRDVVAALREAGVGSVNIDMLYGLPFQTPERLARTTEQVLSLRPDRIALFGYAHVPWMKSHQKLIPEDALPGPAQRLADAIQSAEAICAAGYDKIGIDHFALPGDKLAVAAREGALHRNFQGYVEDDCPVLIGLGASSIGFFEGGYLQNEVASGRHAAAVAAGRLPHDRGIALTPDDRQRAWIIERLMCDFAFSQEGLHARFGGAADHLWPCAEEIAAGDCGPFVSTADGVFAILPGARIYARSIAAQFDAFLNGTGGRHSAAV